MSDSYLQILNAGDFKEDDYDYRDHLEDTKLALEELFKGDCTFELDEEYNIYISWWRIDYFSDNRDTIRQIAQKLYRLEVLEDRIYQAEMDALDRDLYD